MRADEVTGEARGRDDPAHDDTLSTAETAMSVRLAATERLHRMTTEVIAAPTTRAALERVLHAALEIEGADFGKIQLVDPTTERLVIVVEEGGEGGFPQELRSIALDDDLVAARAFRSRDRVVVEDVETEASYAPFRHIARRAGYRSVQSTPLLAENGESFGVLTTHRVKPGVPTERERRLLDVLAQHAAGLIERRRAADDLRDLNLTLERRVLERTREVRESEGRFQALVHASAQIVWTADATGAVVDDSPSWRAVTGQSAQERAGLGWLDAFHPDDREEATLAWRTAVGREDLFDVELRLAHAQDGWRWNHVRAVPLHDDGGRQRGWVGMCSDVSERRRAEAQLREVRSRLTMAEQQERRRVSAILHDDLQQRLYGIQMKMALVRQSADEGDWEVARTRIEEAYAWIDRAVTTTRQLTVDLSPPLLPGEGLTDAVEWLCTELAELNGLAVRLEAAHAFPIADQDMRVLLFQIVRELLLNVVQHSGTDRARVSLGEEGDRIVITVEDDGGGFDTGALDRDGDGPAHLGLFGIRERIALFGGSVDVRSTPGTGTRVTVDMPL
jgi:PAS domain S-box-containing protein